MQTVSDSNFGPLIAYLVPGATVLLGLSQLSPTIATWFAAEPTTPPTIGGFLYLTLASFAAGMTVSAVRWVVVDTMHAWTGLPMPRLDFSDLGRNVTALSLLIEIHYRHYLWFSNELVALAIAYGCYRVNLGVTAEVGWLDALFVLLEGVFFAASRDTMTKFHVRSHQLLSHS